MNANQPLIDHINSTFHKRKLGRYYASEVWAMHSGWLKPKHFFQKRTIDEAGAMNIATTGIPHEYEPKKVIKIKEGIVLVVKPDFVFPKSILETKAPVKVTRRILPKWEFQLEAEYRAFNKPVYLGVFGNNRHRRLWLDVYPYQPDDKRWAFMDMGKAKK